MTAPTLSEQCTTHFVQAYKNSQHDYDIPGESYEEEGVHTFTAVFILGADDHHSWPEIPSNHNRVAVDIDVTSEGDEDIASVSSYFVED